MPALDMPIKELEKYMGVNPRPTDFDEYWITRQYLSTIYTIRGL